MKQPRHRGSSDYDQWRAEGHDGYFEGLTVSDAPYSPFDGLRWSWWVAGWRRARDEDQNVSMERSDETTVGDSNG